MRRHEPLDDPGQKLFVYEHVDELCGDFRFSGAYLGKWNSKATATSLRMSLESGSRGRSDAAAPGIRRQWWVGRAGDSKWQLHY